MQTSPTKTALSEKEKSQIVIDLLAYALYDRREETEVRNAFAHLVQERHAQFHDKEGIETDFIDCSNQVCVKSLEILQTAKSPRIELNELSMTLMESYLIKIVQQGNSYVGVLEDKEKIAVPEKGIELV